MAVLAQSPVDVLDVHDGVVHQFTDGHGQAAQRHRVDGQAKPLEYQRRDHDRQRNGRERDERGAEVEQENEQDDYHQDAAVAKGFLDVVDSQVDERLLLI